MDIRKGLWYWNTKLETMPREQLLELQAQRLFETVFHGASHSSFYRKMFKEIGLHPSEIISLDQFRRIPVTNPNDLIQTPFDFQAQHAAGVFCSGGTTGKPKYSFYTSSDLEYVYERSARSFTACGIGPSDIVAIAESFDIWLIGHDFLQALSRIGSLPLPIGKGTDTVYSIELIRTLRATAIASGPSHVSRLAEYIRALGIDPATNFFVRKLLLSGEVINPTRQNALEKVWEAKVFSIYGSGECGTLGSECLFRNGIHLWEDHFYVEVLDPVTRSEAKPGQIGELVITTLTAKAMPLIRYRLGDLVVVLDGECQCGRTHQRVIIKGRAEEGIALQSGNKIFAYQLGELLSQFPEIIEYQMIVEEKERKDLLTLMIVPQDDMQNQDMSWLQQRMTQAISHLSIDFSPDYGKTCFVEVKIAQPSEIIRTPRGKARVFIDRRNFVTIQPDEGLATI